MSRLSPIDIVIVFIYFVAMMGFGVWKSRGQTTAEDYFLGGRNLKWWMVGISMVVSDIGALELVGVAGSAYLAGLAVANFEWIGCIPAMIVAAFLFIPFYWKARIYTIPEYLGRRYNDVVRAIVAILWGLFMAVNLGIFLWTAAKTLELLIGWPIYVSILLTAVVIGGYTLFGGLKAVVYTDTLQFFVLVLGSLVILVLGLREVGGLEGLRASVQAVGGSGRETFFQLVLPADTPHAFSWPAILLGLSLVLSPAYWVGNQAIVQRCLGTPTERDAKKAVLFGALLKTTIPFLIVLPGMIGFALFPDLEHADDIYPTLLVHLLPAGLAGIVFSGFLAALMSSVDSYLNSASTLWTIDLYQRHINRDASPEKLFRVGRALSGVFIVMAVLLAPVTELFPGIFSAMQTLLAFFQGPIFAILLLGMAWRRTNATAATVGLISGVCTSVTMFWLKESIFTSADPFLYIAWWAFLVALLITVFVTLLTPPPPLKKTEGLTADFLTAST